MLCIAVCEVVDKDLRKSGDIWVQPHEDCVMTRFFFVYTHGLAVGYETHFDKKETRQVFERAAAQS